MCDRTCANCAYVCGVRKGPKGMLVCANCPEAPGDLTRVQGDGCCPRFRAKPEPVVRLEPPAPPDERTKLIPLTKGKFAMVDAADFEWLNQFKWHAIKVADNYYACRKEGGKSILMHRQIMNPPKGMVVDHKNHTTLDNHRCNLRVCTQAQNLYNTRSHSRSGYKGVSPKGDKWEAKIKHRGQWYHLGLFDDPVEAARARDRMAVKLFGEYAWLNLPEEVHDPVTELAGAARGRSRATARRSTAAGRAAGTDQAERKEKRRKKSGGRSGGESAKTHRSVSSATGNVPSS